MYRNKKCSVREVYLCMVILGVLWSPGRKTMMYQGLGSQRRPDFISILGLAAIKIICWLCCIGIINRKCNFRKFPWNLGQSMEWNIVSVFTYNTPPFVMCLFVLTSLVCYGLFYDCPLGKDWHEALFPRLGIFFAYFKAKTTSYFVWILHSSFNCYQSPLSPQTICPCVLIELNNFGVVTSLPWNCYIVSICGEWPHVPSGEFIQHIQYYCVCMCRVYRAGSRWIKLCV